MEIRVVQPFEGDRVRAGMEQEWKQGLSSLLKATGREQEWDRNGNKGCPALLKATEIRQEQGCDKGWEAKYGLSNLF